jgi:hypothetical protein
VKSDLLIIGGVAAAILGVLWWAKNKIAAGAINPANPDNLVNSAVNGVVADVTGNPNQTLVGWFDDVFGINQGLAPGERVDPNTGLILAAPASQQTAAAPIY